jgi:hypothetical protein
MGHKHKRGTIGGPCQRGLARREGRRENWNPLSTENGSGLGEYKRGGEFDQSSFTETSPWNFFVKLIYTKGRKKDRKEKRKEEREKECLEGQRVVLHLSR